MEILWSTSYEIDNDVSDSDIVRCEVIKTIDNDGVTFQPGKKYIGKQGITITIDKRQR